MIENILIYRVTAIQSQSRQGFQFILSLLQL